MIISGSVLRGSIATLYLLIISTATFLTYFYYSEPVLFVFVCSAVSLLVLSYPVLCLFQLSKSYDLEVCSVCNWQWIPSSVDLEAQKCSVCDVPEKPSKLDLAFVNAYM